MRTKTYRVTLTSEEVEHLQGLLRRGKCGAAKRRRAQALLLANDPANLDSSITQGSGLKERAVQNLRKRFVEEGFEKTLNGIPKGHRPRAIQGKDEARLIALACEKRPDGESRWSLRLLAERWATLENVENPSASREAIRTFLKKANSNLGRKKNGASRRKNAPSL